MYHFVVDVLQPVPLLVIASAAGLFNLWRKRNATRRALLLVTIPLALLLLYSTSAVSYLAAGMLEWRFPNLDTRPNDVAAIAVLGGGVIWPETDDAPTRLSKNALGRCYRAVELYRQGKPCPILVSGGKANSNRPGPPEAHVLRDCLMTMGIPESDILMEDRSRTTYENAIESAWMLKQRKIESVLLVTDATHLLRSKLCFEKQGMQVVPAGSYYLTEENWGPFSFLPSPGAARQNDTVFHEVGGLIWYWLHDRI